jgi:hypothetical protein
MGTQTTEARALGHKRKVPDLAMFGLGSRARLIRKLTIDHDALCPLGCTNDYVSPLINDVFPYESGLIEAHSLLRMIWSETLDLELTVVQPLAQAF